MSKFKVGYTKGLNKDLAKDKYNNQNYFDANNIRVITSAGLSSGSIENEKGNKLLFSFPTVGKRIKVNIDSGISTGSVTINATTVSYDTTQDNTSFYNELIGTSAIATLISNNDIYVYVNDTGVFIQILNSATTSSFTNTIGTAGSTYSAATSTIYICGWCRLNEWLIVFTTNSEIAEPTSALCQIWKFKFTDGSRTLINGASVAGVLDNTEHLIYNDYLNYSTVTYIRDTVTNYETGNKGRVYWTDYFNQIRVINIFDSELMSNKTTDLDLISEVTLAKPIIQIIENTTNGIPASSAIQYYYKLLDTDGRETIFSPGSQVIILNEELTNDVSLGYHDIDATTPNTVNNKSITIEINDVDTDYNIIEYYVVLWLSPNSPLIYKVGEDTVTDSFMSFTHSTMDDAIPIPLVSFMSIGVPFTAKTIATNNKTLDAGNIKETSFDIDFEARAFRFNTDATPNFDLFEADGTSVNYTAATMSTVPETSDAINPTNDDTNTTYNYENTGNRQIYQSDGTTIGGEGVNVSYTFEVHGRSASIGSPQLATSSSNTTGYNQTNKRVGIVETAFNEFSEDGSVIQYNIENELDSGKSTKLNALLTGRARGEVYRAGIVFFSKQGQRSFVKWIGDIKFPDPSLGDDYKIQHSTDATSNDTTTAGDVTMYEIGLSITIDITSIKDQISGFKYVFVERTQADKTRLGTGVVTNFVNYADGGTDAVTQNPFTLLRKYAIDVYTAGLATNRDHAISGIMNILGVNYGDDVPVAPDNDINLVLNDSPDILSTNGNPTVALNSYNKIWLNLTSPESEFRSYTSFNANTNTDFIRDYGYYSCVEQVFTDDFLNLSAGTGDIKQAQLGFLYRAKQFVSLSSLAQTHQNYSIAADRYLVNGEVIGNNGSLLANSEDTALVGTANAFGTTGIEAVLNTSYSFYHDELPIGLGTQKQFLRLDTTTSGYITTGNSLNVKTLAVGDILPSGVVGDIAASAALYQGITRYFKEIAYCRVVTNQYGGNTYVARSKNTYIDSGHYQMVTPNMANTFTASVYGGDIYTVSHAREYLHQYHTATAESSFKEPNSTSHDTKMSIAFMFCAECSVNTAYRLGEYFGGESTDAALYFHGSVDPARDSGDMSIDETFQVIPLYQQKNNVRTDYIAKDFLLDTVNKFPNRIKVSNIKIDGELTDNWRRFPVNQFTDVSGSLGEIHKLISFKGNLLFFQDRGIGNQPILERAVIQDVTGAELILGNGDLIGQWQYITETSGSKHQHSIVASDKTLYYYDTLQSKLCTVQQNSLSEQLGLASYFHNELLESLRVNDDLYKANPIGVVGIYDKKNERVFFTFLGGNVIKDETAGYYDVLDIVLYSSVYYRCLIQGNYTYTDLTNTTYFEVISNYKKGITLAFNEKLSDFESMYDFKPGNYLQYDDKLISINHNTRVSGYIHEEGDYGKFYENYYPSDIVLVVMPNPNIVSIFNNIEYFSEITIDKENVVGETLNSLQLWNNHQNSGKVTLSVGTIAKQRIQTWRHKFKRDTLNTNASLKPRMRNYYLLLKLRYDNNDNKRLVLSDIVISYTATNKM